MNKTIEELKTEALYLVNDSNYPARYGEIDLQNVKTQATAQHRPRKGILCRTVATGICGSDLMFIEMGQKSELEKIFPPGSRRLIIGHEGVIYVPQEKTYAVLNIRGGSGSDPSRYGDREILFEHGCYKRDGLMCKEGLFNPDMIIPVSRKFLPAKKKISLSLAKRLVFCDPYACSLFVKERVEDIALGHNYRIFRKEAGSKEKAFRLAKDKIFDRTVIFGYGTIGLMLALVLNKSFPGRKKRIVAVGRSHPDVKKVKLLKKMTDISYVQVEGSEKDQANSIIKALGGKASLFIGTSGNEIESRIAFNFGVLGHNAIYSSFSVGPPVTIDSLDFGFKNQLNYGAINYRFEHMMKASRELPDIPLDDLVEVFPLDVLKKNPTDFIKSVFSKGKDSIKTLVIWDKELISD